MGGYTAADIPYDSTKSVKDKLYAVAGQSEHFLFHQIPGGGQTRTIPLGNPCFFFISSTDANFAIRYLSNSTFNIIGGTLPSAVTISRPNNTSIVITNNLDWSISFWALQ